MTNTKKIIELEHRIEALEKMTCVSAAQALREGLDEALNNELIDVPDNIMIYEECDGSFSIGFNDGEQWLNQHYGVYGVMVERLKPTKGLKLKPIELGDWEVGDVIVLTNKDDLYYYHIVLKEGYGAFVVDNKKIDFFLLNDGAQYYKVVKPK